MLLPALYRPYDSAMAPRVQQYTHRRVRSKQTSTPPAPCRSELDPPLACILVSILYTVWKCVCGLRHLVVCVEGSMALPLHECRGLHPHKREPQAHYRGQSPAGSQRFLETPCSALHCTSAARQPQGCSFQRRSRRELATRAVEEAEAVTQEEPRDDDVRRRQALPRTAASICDRVQSYQH